VSVVIPTRDRATLLRNCIASLRDNTDYAPLEIVVVDNDSTEPEAKRYLALLEKEERTRVVSVPGGFNFSRLVNRGAAAASGDVLLLLNNDVETTEAGWLREMVSQVLRPEVGAVGARLWFPDGTLQHGGVILGLGGVASHAFHRFSRKLTAPPLRTFFLTQNYSAVTAACMAVRKSVFETAGGFDEALPGNFNDVDFCLRLRERGLQIIWTPYANLVHRESASRSLADLQRNQREMDWMSQRWGAQLVNDPYYSPNLTLALPGFDFAFPPRLALVDQEWSLTRSD
jgi:GT2 family glycosyltransferase